MVSWKKVEFFAGKRGQSVNLGIPSSRMESSCIVGGQAYLVCGGHGGGGGGGCVPEIDPGVASSAIALLTCTLLTLTSRHPQKT